MAPLSWLRYGEESHNLLAIASREANLDPKYLKVPGDGWSRPYADRHSQLFGLVQLGTLEGSPIVSGDCLDY